MPLTKLDSYTTEYIYSLPEGQHAELIDGVLYNMAPPSVMHQKISGILHMEIYSYIKKKKGGVRGVFCSFCGILKCR